MKKSILPIKKTSSTRRRGDGPDIVYEYVRDKIINLQLKAGGRIEERYIVEKLGLSRTPVRQAFMRLAAEGLIELLPNYGARVPPLNIEEVRSFLEAFEYMLLATTHLAAKRRTEKDLVEIIRQRDAYEKAAKANDVKALIDTNELFHLAIAVAGHNQYMARMVGDLLTKSLRLDGFWYHQTFNPTLESNIEDSLIEHRQIVQAIVDREVGKAEELTSLHVGTFRRPMIEFLCHSDVDDFDINFPENFS